MTKNNGKVKGYYKPEIITKFCESLATANLEKPEKVTFSHGNRKMGEIPSVSLLPFVTCPKDRIKNTCGVYCYAAKIANLYPNVRDSYARNTSLAFYDLENYFNQIRNFAKTQRYFRYHVSGDIPNGKYFEKMIETALAVPACDFLAFTKQFEIVNKWISENGELPKNLHILFSGEENLKPINPYSLPETTVLEKGIDFNSLDNVKLCGGNCFECCCRGVGCWESKPGDKIGFIKH